MELVINDLNWAWREVFNEREFSIDTIGLDVVESPALNGPQHSPLKAQFYPIIGIIPAALGVIVFTVELVAGLILTAKASIHVYNASETEAEEAEAEFNHAVDWIREAGACLCVSIVNPLVVNLAYVPIKISHLVISTYMDAFYR